MTANIESTYIPIKSQSQDIGYVLEWDEDFIHIRCPFCDNTDLLENRFLDAPENFLIKRCKEYKNPDSDLFMKELRQCSGLRKWGYYVAQFPVDRYRELAMYEIDKEERSFVSCMDIPDVMESEVDRLESIKCEYVREGDGVVSEALDSADEPIGLIESFSALGLEGTRATSRASVVTKESSFKQLGNTFSKLLSDCKEEDRSHDVGKLLSSVQAFMDPHSITSIIHMKPPSYLKKYWLLLNNIRTILRNKSQTGLCVSRNESNAKLIRLVFESN